MRRQDREAFERERANSRTQLRAQLANHATSVFVVLNAGGLAAALAWMQSLPLDVEKFSCNYILIRTIPWAAGLLLAGVLSTAISYLLRYRADDVGKVQVGWMVAIASSAAFLVIAGVVVSYPVTDCRSLAFNAKLKSDLESSLRLYELLPDGEKASHLKDLRRRSDRSSSDLRFAIIESDFKERLELERKLKRVQELKREMSLRIEQNGDTKSKSLAEELQYIVELEQSLTGQLRE